MSDYEKLNDQIEILGGEEKVEELYKKFGSEKISVISLRRFIKVQKIKLSYNQKKSIAKIAKETGVSKMTVYRWLRNFKIYPKK